MKLIRLFDSSNFVNPEHIQCVILTYDALESSYKMRITFINSEELIHLATNDVDTAKDTVAEFINSINQ